MTTVKHSGSSGAGKKQDPIRPNLETSGSPCFAVSKSKQPSRPTTALAKSCTLLSKNFISEHTIASGASWETAVGQAGVPSPQSECTHTHTHTSLAVQCRQEEEWLIFS